MTRKRRSKKDTQIDFLQNLLENNATAIQEGPQKKRRWSTHDLREIKPLTDNQRLMFEAYLNGNHVVASGSAGTGKSYCALYLALNDIFSGHNQRKSIKIVRSATPTKAIGFLPGDISEKLLPYELPYIDIVANLLNRHTAYENLKESNIIEFVSTSLIRGLTWDNSIVIIDEAQSCTFHELDSVITRLGENSSLIICGDIAQNDLIYTKFETSGFNDILKILKNVKNIEIVNFTEYDIVRSKFIKDYLIAKQNIK